MNAPEKIYIRFDKDFKRVIDVILRSDVRTLQAEDYLLLSVHEKELATLKAENEELITEVLRYAKGIDDIYNQNEACRHGVLVNMGMLHSPLTIRLRSLASEKGE